MWRPTAQGHGGGSGLPPGRVRGGALQPLCVQRQNQVRGMWGQLRVPEEEAKGRQFQPALELPWSKQKRSRAEYSTLQQLIVMITQPLVQDAKTYQGLFGYFAP